MVGEHLPNGLRRAPAWAALCLAAAWGCGAPGVPPAEDPGGEPVQVRAGVDRATATIGDRVTFSLVITRPADLEVEVPEPAGELGGLRIEDRALEPARRASRDDRVVERSTYTLVADRVGSYVIPRLAVRYGEGEDGGSVETPEVFVEVASVLPDDESELSDIRDVKPLHRLARRWAVLLAAAAAALLAIALAAALWWWWRRRRAGATEPALAPHEVALRALECLWRTDFTDPEALRRYYFALSETLRAYVEGRFGLNATDLTTEEILGRIAELPALPPADADRLRGFLTATDRVKYAAVLPSRREIDATFRAAVSFVESTRPSAGGEEAPAGGGATLAPAGSG
jgi:hypothetical protein